MNFAEAFAAVLQDQCVRRDDWGRARYIRRCGNVSIYGYAVTTSLIMVMKDGRTNTFVPSQCDMFAEDWRVVSRKGDG